jgi:hypothetical protein
VTGVADITGSWPERGLCRGLRSTVGGVTQALEVFYPTPGRVAMRFRLVCNVCPVECECFTWGLLAEDYGGWGGTDEHERKAMREDIASGAATFADILRDRGCDEIAERVEADDAAVIAETAQLAARPTG